MKPFLDVSAAMQVGVRRSPCIRSGYLEEWNSDSAEKIALVDAGLLDLMRRAGASTVRVEPTPIPPAEDRRIAESAAEPLAAAIDLGLRDIVIEWAKAAAIRGRVAPYAALVRLLEWLPKHREELTPVLGSRGIWLAALMGIEVAAIAPDQDAGDYRSTLIGEWDQLDWKERVEAITKLAADLFPEDEFLLTAALSDRRKDVRELAATQLARLSNSAFAKELRDVAKGRLRVERKLIAKTLFVNPPEPEDLPKSLPRTSARASFGPKAQALFDLARLVPPAFWVEETGLSPPELLSLANKTEYADALIYAWLEAATTHLRDQIWIDALFHFFEAKSNQQAFMMLARIASEPDFEAVYRPKLKLNAYLPARTTPYSPQFSKLVVEAAKQGTVSFDKETQKCLDLSVLPMLREPWDTHADPIREHWYRCLDLRKRLAESLDP